VEARSTGQGKIVLDACKKSLKCLRLVFQLHAEFAITRYTHRRHILRHLWVNVFCVCAIGKPEILRCMFITKELLVRVRKMFVPGHMFISHTVCQQGRRSKNHTVIHLYMASIDIGMFDYIYQFFLAHFVFVKSVKEVLIMHILYVELTINASKSNHFSVKVVYTEDILYFTVWWPKCYLRSGFPLEI
jgi:hypothetical protein